TWAPFAFSGVYLAGAVPALFVGSVAGVCVDRWDKRRTMLVIDILRALLIILLLLVTGQVPLPLIGHYALSVWGQLLAIYLTVALISACGQFFGPAEMALIGDIVPEQQRSQASALSYMAGSIGWIIGPALGSLLFVTLGPLLSVLVNAFSFLISWLMVLAIQSPTSARSVVAGKRSHFWLSLLVWGGTMLLLARQDQFCPVVVLLFCLGVCNASIGAGVMPLLLRATPRDMIGRVSGVTGPCMSVAVLLSTFLTGFLSSTALHHFHVNVFGIRFGFVDTMYTLAGLLACVAGFYAMRKLRNVPPLTSAMEEESQQ
ncbi:MAG: MFS transporter, partial [Ktedonobacteraceae bacterium]